MLVFGGEFVLWRGFAVVGTFILGIGLVEVLVTILVEVGHVLLTDREQFMPPVGQLGHDFAVSQIAGDDSIGGSVLLEGNGVLIGAKGEIEPGGVVLHDQAVDRCLLLSQSLAGSAGLCRFL